MNSQECRKFCRKFVNLEHYFVKVLLPFFSVLFPLPNDMSADGTSFVNLPISEMTFCYFLNNFSIEQVNKHNKYKTYRSYNSHGSK